MSLIYPTFSQGFANNPFDSAYPNLWVGLAGIWSTELGKTGDKIYDLSGLNHTATLSNLAFTGTTSNWFPGGKYGYAINYDGSNDFASTANIPQINSVSKTISVMFWVRTTAASNNCIISYDSNDSLSPSADFYIYTPANLAFGGFCDGNERSSGVAINDGKWHHICIVGRKTSVEMWMDGILRFSATGLTQKGTDYTTSHTLRFADNSNVSHFPGDIGEVRVYSRDLAGDEIRQSYLGASPLSLSPLFIKSPFILQTVDESENITITDSLSADLRTVNESDNLTISDFLQATDTNAIISDNITITDSFSVDLRTVNESDNITVSDSMIIDEVNTNTSTSYGIRILSINPLLFISQDLEIINVDTTIPSSPTWVIEPILGVTDVYDAFINNTNEFVYISANNGLVIKIEIADLTNQTIINISDSNNLSTIDGLPLFGLTYTSTDETTGELYVIDERNTFLIDSDIEVLAQQLFNINSDFSLIHAFKLDSDITVLNYNNFYINTDFKCLTTALIDIDPIKQSDFHVFIDNIEVIDPDLSLDSISITHTFNQESVATFKLNRHHDNLNYNLDGDFIEINNQNDLRIEIDGNVEFDGKIGDLDCQYNLTSEQINVTAYQFNPNYLFNHVTLPIASIDKRLSLYDVLVENPKITNPYIDPRIVIVSNDNHFWTNGGTWAFNLNDVQVFASYQAALDYIEANSNNFIFTARNPSVGYPNGTPKKYLGIIADLGDLVEQQVNNQFDSDAFGTVASGIQDGSFNPLQNWTYFWSATVIKPSIIPQITNTLPNKPENIDFSQIKLPVFKLPEFKFPGTNATGTTSMIHFLYIGTSLAPVSSDIWILKHAEHHRQRIYDDKITKLGFYSVGSAPFKLVSPRNGVLLTKWRYSDENNGLYAITPESYDYREYVKKIVDLEYQKLKNINEEILPETSCSLTLGIDAYYYYNLKLLTRINIDNTVSSNIYKNNNGFPVSIKSITITSSDMNLNIQADNLKSTVELSILDSQFPDDEDFIVPEKRLFIVPKSDMKTGLEVE